MEFLDYKISGDKLVITVDDREYFDEFIEYDLDGDTASYNSELLVYENEFQGNEFDWVSPEDIGALVSDGAPIFYAFEDGEYYWYPDYQIRSWLDVLNRDGEVEFALVPEYED